MGDKDRDLKILCESIAEDFLKNQENDGGPVGNNERFLMSSKPYVRKNNVVSDKSLNFCWETHLRFNDYDLYISILRRSYIPPIMDMFQDIIVCSKHKFDLDEAKGVELPQTKETEEKNNKNSFEHLCNNHRKIMDSIH
jgi:hypothetical protein